MSINRQKLFLCLCAGIVLLIPALRSTIISFLLALFLAGCLQRPIQAAQKRGIPRWLSSSAFLLLGLVPLIGLGAACIWYLLRSAQQLAAALLPLLDGTGIGSEWLYLRITSLPPAARELCDTLLQALAAQKDALVGQLVQYAAQWSSSAVTEVPGKLGKAGIFLLFLLLGAIGYPELCTLFVRALPPDWCRWLRNTRRTAANRFRAWLRAEGKLVLLIGAELSLGLAALRTVHWPILAALIALIDLLPMIGSGLILLPWALIQWILGNQISALGLFSLWLCVWLTRTLLEPKLIGHQLQLPTALAFLTGVLGLRLWGFKGLILFPVLSAVAVSLLPKKNAQP